MIGDCRYWRFLMDTMESRRMTEGLILFESGWAKTHFDALGDEDVRESAMRSIILSMGGFYELLYWRLSRNEHFDTAREVRVVMLSFASALGLPETDAAEAIDKDFDVDRIGALVEKISIP